jgi:hypothetical protein
MYQQVISILTIPPGNLVYHLVLAFSIAGALPGALWFTTWYWLFQLPAPYQVR